MAAVMIFTMAAGVSAAEAKPSPSAPKNVQVKFLKTIEESERSWLLAEVSWDELKDLTSDDFVEMMSMLGDTAKSEGYLISDARPSFSLMNGGSDEYSYQTSGGRSKINVKIPILKEGEEQIGNDNIFGETAAKGIKEGDTFTIEMFVAGWTQESGSYESEISRVVCKYTTDNVKNQVTFTESGIAAVKKKNKIKASIKSYSKAYNGKKTVTVARKKFIKLSKAKGTVTYKITNSKTKKITISKKTGKLTIKKGLKKGTYKFKIKVKAAGTKTYAAKTVTKKVKVVYNGSKIKISKY
jgi:hypothetical protein